MTDISNALTVEDQNLDDLNQISSVVKLPPSTWRITESYGESGLIAYDPYGLGVYNSIAGWFDKIITIEPNEPNDDPRINFTLDFEVTNNTPYDWTDYHLEFWEVSGEDFVNPLTGIDFDNGSRVPKKFNASGTNADRSASIYSDGLLAPGETNTFWIEFKTEMPLTFGIRQVATTAPIPEPTTMLLLGAGMIGLAGLGRKKLFKIG